MHMPCSNTWHSDRLQGGKGPFGGWGSMYESAPLEKEQWLHFGASKKGDWHTAQLSYLASLLPNTLNCATGFRTLHDLERTVASIIFSGTSKCRKKKVSTPHSGHDNCYYLRGMIHPRHPGALFNLRGQRRAEWKRPHGVRVSSSRSQLSIGSCGGQGQISSESISSSKKQG